MTSRRDDQPLVLAIDLGTSSVRALAFDASGRALPDSECQFPYALQTGSDGSAVVDPQVLSELAAGAIDGCLNNLGNRAGSIAAVGMTSFWHGVMGLGPDHQPLTPMYFWADTRSSPDAALLRREFDEPAILQRTGCRFHSSYWPAKLHWLRRTDPTTFARVSRWCSFSEYLLGTWCQGAATGVSISMASGTGLLDVHRLIWDEEALAASGISRDLLSPFSPDRAGGTLRSDVAHRWPALAGIPWFPALGDGACANVGSGAIGPGRIAITIGTSGAMRLVLPAPRDRRWIAAPELWAYRLDEELAVLGGALSNGGNLVAWMRNSLQFSDAAAIEQEAAAVAPDSHGLTVLPFLAGERSPAWHDEAEGVIAGLRLSTTPAEIYRAGLEATAYRFAQIYDDLAPLAETSHQIVANGGALLQSPLWLQITADVLGHDLLTLPPNEESSARGAAAMALVAAGIADTLSALPDPAAEAKVVRANPAAHNRYRRARERHRHLEAMLVHREWTWDAGTSAMKD